MKTVYFNAMTGKDLEEIVNYHRPLTADEPYSGSTVPVIDFR